jgi:hypothetical protein
VMELYPESRKGKRLKNGLRAKVSKVLPSEIRTDRVNLIRKTPKAKRLPEMCSLFVIFF